MITAAKKKIRKFEKKTPKTYVARHNVMEDDAIHKVKGKRAKAQEPQFFPQVHVTFFSGKTKLEYEPNKKISIHVKQHTCMIEQQLHIQKPQRIREHNKRSGFKLKKAA